MNYFKQVLETYLTDIDNEMAAASDYETLKMIHDMGLGVLLYCYNAGIITADEQISRVQNLNDRYGSLWQKHLEKQNS
jgi:hypothetical protein